MKLLNRINTVLLQMTYSLLVKSRKAISQIVTIVCILFLIGCDTDNSNNDVAPKRARLIKITPAVSEIERYTPEMELVFDKPVAQVKVTAVSEIEPHTPEWEVVFDKPGAQVEVNEVDADPNQTISVGAWQSTTVWTLDLSLFEKIHPPTQPFSTGDFLQTQVCFTVSYVDETGIYQEDLDCVRLPFIDGGYIQPRIIEGTVKDGDVGVEADKLNIYGITLQFSEEATGYLAIRPEGEKEYLGWHYEWSKDGFGESVRLYRVPGGGKKLLNGTVYIIEISVKDLGGNVLTNTITFTTKV